MLPITNEIATVAGGVNMRIGGLAGFIYADSIVTIEPCGLRDFSIGNAAYTDQHQVRIDDFAGFQLCATDFAPVAQQPGQAGRFMQADSMPAVQVTKVIRGCGGGDALQDTLGHFQHGNFEPELTPDRCRFESDISAADD